MEVFIVIETDSDCSYDVRVFDGESSAKNHYMELKDKLLNDFDNKPYEQYEEDEHHFEYVDYEEDKKYSIRMTKAEVNHE